MINRNLNRSVGRQARILAAIGVISLALVAASPASAIYRSYEPAESDPPTTESTVNTQSNDPPTDENGKKSCWHWDGWHPHGTVFTLWKGAGKSTFRCDDGNWVLVDYTSSTYDNHYEASSATY